MQHRRVVGLFLWMAYFLTDVRIADGESFATLRNRMVDEAVIAAGVCDPRVIASMRATPRHEFVLPTQQKYAYLDMALPIGKSQTISPPFVVAYMTEQLDPKETDRVLEIGTGSGYQAAVLSPLVEEVFTIEIVESLGKKAAQTLKFLKYDNVTVHIGDGYQGWVDKAPFDKIIVTCSPEKVPRPLVDQLREGGQMIIPVGERYQQTLHLLTKRNGKLVSKIRLPTLFVPMTGVVETMQKGQEKFLSPQLTNGGFEEGWDETDMPRGWHYVRQLRRVENQSEAPQGRHFVTLASEHPERSSGALQGLAVEGRNISELQLSFWVKGKKIAQGQSRHAWPKLILTFYGPSRETVGRAMLGSWRGTFPWHEETLRIRVPIMAREAILRMGLMGATGEISFDDLRLEPVSQ